MDKNEDNEGSILSGSVTCVVAVANAVNAAVDTKCPPSKVRLQGCEEGGEVVEWGGVEQGDSGGGGQIKPGRGTSSVVAVVNMES